MGLAGSSGLNPISEMSTINIETKAVAVQLLISKSRFNVPGPNKIYFISIMNQGMLSAPSLIKMFANYELGFCLPAPIVNWVSVSLANVFQIHISPYP